MQWKNNYKRRVRGFSVCVMILILAFSMCACGNSSTKGRDAESVGGNTSESVTETGRGTKADETVDALADKSQETSQEETSIEGTESEDAESDDMESSEDSLEDEDTQTENLTEGDNMDEQSDGDGNDQNEQIVTEEEPQTEIEETVPEIKDIVICIDPGHGGSEEGTKETYDNKLVMEKDLNGRIATSLKNYLEQYDHVKVVLTHNATEDMGLSARINYAAANNADYFVSVHVNSKSTDEVNSSGCMVIMGCSRYQPGNCKVSSRYDTEMTMAKSIISRLNGLGIPVANDMNVQNTGGILQRPTTVGETYPDGSVADYYSLLYCGTKAGIPSIIVEHAFLSNESDYRNFLSTDAKLDALAKADAEGIMAAIR